MQRNRRGSILSKAVCYFGPAVIVVGMLSVSMEALPQKMRPSYEASVSACFTPGENCEQELLYQIRQAKSEIKILAYSFTAKPIRDALLQAHKKGVAIELVIDTEEAQDKHSVAVDLAKRGIPVFLDSSVHHAHNKVMIIDRQTVITGSYNFSASANKRNAENLVIIRNSDALARDYLENYEKRRASAERAEIAFN